MVLELRHDPFGRRTLYRNKLTYSGHCNACDRVRKTLYQYVWKRDDDNTPIYGWSRRPAYCNVRCAEHNYSV